MFKKIICIIGIILGTIAISGIVTLLNIYPNNNVTNYGKILEDVYNTFYSNPFYIWLTLAVGCLVLMLATSSLIMISRKKKD